MPAWSFLLPLLLLYGTVLGLFGHLLLSRKTHTSLILWTCWLWLFPPLGIPLYLLLGTDKIHRKRYAAFIQGIPDPPDPLPERRVPAPLSDLGRIPENRLAGITRPEPLWDGDAFYQRLLGDIDQAAESIFFQTYVWRDDEKGILIRDALCRAAARGLDVRVMTDEMGSFKTERAFFKPLIEAGGRFSWYSTVQTRRSRFFFNLRNHRKITVLDGRTAYIGGMNIGKEYAGEQIGPWRDLQLRFSGSAIPHLLASFAEDWRFATDDPLDPTQYRHPPPRPETEIPVALVRSGPNDREPSFMQSFQMLCGHARRRLDLFTPYFVPNEHILTTLQTTALRGVRIRLMIPTLNEHQYMVDIGRASYEPLLEAGVEIYELPGLVHHAKLFRIDDDLIFAGSHNLDTRSFKLNFELSCCFRDPLTARAIDKTTAPLFEASRRIDPDTFPLRPLRQKLKQGFIRLFSPVL